MNESKTLTGNQLVAKGTTTKLNVSLPEVGLKDIISSGSWLEQKQIQSAIEARKHLIEVERIEKCGVLSHAQWREELMLAEVTQKVGGYWQYIGHNNGKQLFLRPEEALFLMEIVLIHLPSKILTPCLLGHRDLIYIGWCLQNCLRLMYNEVTVSLQQGYSLLLREKISEIQYKVYSSLSRLGYKVFRHDISKLTEYEKKLNLTPYTKPTNMKQLTEPIPDEQNIENKTDIIDNIQNESDPERKEEYNSVKGEEVEDNQVDNDLNNIKNNAMDMNCDNKNANESGTQSIDENNVRVEFITQDENINNQNINGSQTSCGNTTPTTSTSADIIIKNTNISNRIQNQINNNPFVRNKHTKLQKLKQRKPNIKYIDCVHKYFENVPDMYQKHVVNVNAPEQRHVPENINLYNKCYILNLDNITSRLHRSSFTEPRPYSATDEVNDIHVRRIRSNSTSDSPQNNWIPFYQNSRVDRQTSQFRQFQFWRPRSDFNFFQFNLIFHRPFLPNVLYLPNRSQFYPRIQPIFLRQFPNIINQNSSNANRNSPNNTRKRIRDNGGNFHLAAIKRLAIRLKQLVQGGNRQEANVQALQRLIHTYNVRYKAKLRLTEENDIVEDEIIVETIELDDDDEPKNKRPRSDSNDDFGENLNRLRQLALRLKDLEFKENASSRHRRSFSNLIKTFNKSFNADVYLNANYDIIDRRYITLDSSSDSDCVIEELPAKKTGKKLKNPFNILKRLSEKHNAVVNFNASTSKDNSTQSDEDLTGEDTVEQPIIYSELLMKTFNKNWLPDKNDFGRAEVPLLSQMDNLLDSNKEVFLYDFLRDQPYDCNNWLEIKIAFWKSLQDVEIVSQSSYENPGLNSIIQPEDCTNMPSVLKKLSIIQANKEIQSETSLSIDFDVYNRDIQNFKKSNRPKPHFRIVCISESSFIPSGVEIATLRSKYQDNVAVVFAIVGSGSISYLQMNPTDLPVYIPSNDMP